MTTINPTTTLGELVTTHPQLALASWNCSSWTTAAGGQRTLADACAALGLDAQTTADELADAVIDEPAPDWSAMGLAGISSTTSSRPTTGTCGTNCRGCRRSSPRSCRSTAIATPNSW